VSCIQTPLPYEPSARAQPEPVQSATTLSPWRRCGGDVAGDVEHAFLKIGHGRGEHAGADAGAVDVKLVVADRGDVGEGVRGQGIEAEGFAKPDVIGLRGIGVGDPPALPIGRVEQAGRKRGLVAPRGGLAMHVPNADLPAGNLVGPERLAGVFAVHRFAGSDLP
jgi:hypothetical protein